ncbi:MAG: hypothetical protein PVH18_05960 [Chloroflexota bacterium]|jgi:hypothetical protein
MSIGQIVLLVLIAISGLAALLFFVRGLQARSTPPLHPYAVARQETRHSMQVNFLRAGFLIALTLILLGIYGLVPGEDSETSQATPTVTVAPSPTQEAATTTVSRTPDATPTAEPATPEITATITPTTTATAAATETPAVATAIVNSPNGLWLREAPGGTQEVELIAHQTELELLQGRETADDIDWQQVRTPAGNEGWVAAEFLVYQ